MSLVRLREKQYDEKKDLLKEVNRKILAGDFGLSAPEIQANAINTLLEGASSLKAALMKFVTDDPKMKQVKARLQLIHDRPEPVLITGPTGVGKELLAKALQISGAPFVAENCGGIPEQLVESIFFGHKKGAFTGATEDKIGLLQEAGEGIIFLDEIGDMPLTLQAKFLRAIQENEIRQVGSTKTIDIECRFVAATKYKLEERVDQKLFREDLYARLSTYELHVTGLNERLDDIPLITKSMLPNGRLDELPFPFPPFIMDKIMKYNVRAIEAAIARHRAYNSYE